MHKAIYGKTALLRGKCPECKEEAFVIDNEYQCCGLTATIPSHIGIQKITQGKIRTKTRILSPKTRIKILKEQSHRCFYCRCDLENSWYITRKAKRPKKIKIHFDHVVPWTYSEDDSVVNMVATCNLCNSYKGTRVFNSLKQLKEYLKKTRQMRSVVLF